MTTEKVDDTTQQSDDWWWDRFSFNHRAVAYDPGKGSASWRSRLGVADQEDDWTLDLGISRLRGKKNDPNRHYATALNQLQGSANVMGGDRRLSVRWSNGENANSPTQDTVYLCPDDLVEGTKIKDEAIDALTGKVYMASTLRDTIHPQAWLQATVARAKIGQSDMADAAVRLWQALETSVARHSILENWGGFAAYLSKDEEMTVASKETIQAYLNDSEVKPSTTAVSVALAWNLLHPHDRVRVPDIYDPVLDVVGKALANEIAPEDRFKVSEAIAEQIVKLLAEVDPPFPEDKEEDDSNNGDDKDEDENERNGDRDDDRDEDGDDDEDPKGSSHPLRPGVPRTTDDVQFGGKVSNETDEKLAEEVPERSRDEKGGEPGSIESKYDSYHADEKTTFINMSEGEVSPAAAEAYAETLRELGHAIRCVRDSLAFHHNEMRNPTYGHRSGDIDEGNLFKLALNDDALMQQNEIESRRSIAIALLVDESGSMRGGRDESAAKVAMILAEGLGRIPGITVDVYGHSAEEYGMGHCGTVIREYLTPRSRKPESMRSIEGRSENHDGFAIQHVANKFYGDRKFAEKKMMFVISDGEPCGSWYNGGKAIRHVMEVCNLVRSKLDVAVYGIGVDKGYTNSRGVEMYGSGNFVVLDDVESAAPVIARFVRQVAASMKRKVA
jgi:cobalamin biosynthesis protein CobT